MLVASNCPWDAVDLTRAARRATHACLSSEFSHGGSRGPRPVEDDESTRICTAAEAARLLDRLVGGSWGWFQRFVGYLGALA